MALHHGQFLQQDSGGAPGGGGGDLGGVSGIIAWFDADASRVTKDGSDRVSRITDRSATGVDVVQATSTNQPTWLASQINGEPAIQMQQEVFLGTDWWGMLSESVPAAYDLANEVSMIVIFEWDTAMDNTSDIHPIFGNSENSTQNEGYHFFLQGTSNESRTYVGDDTGSSYTELNIVTGTWYYMKMKWDKDTDSGNMTQTIAGIGSDTFARTGAIPSSTGALGFGTGEGNTVNSFPGKLAEAILIDHKMSGAEESEIDTYINNKYGL